MLGSVYWETKNLILTQFAALEAHTMEQDLGRLDAALQNELETLLTLTIDWAQWDDSYQFMHDFSASYEDSNIDSSTFTNLNIIGIIYLSPTATVERQYRFDFGRETLIEFKTSVMDAIIKVHHEPSISAKFSGLLAVDNDIFIVSSHPILTSEALGPSRGNLVFVRSFNQQMIDTLASRTFLRLKFLTPEALTADGVLKRVNEPFKDNKYVTIPTKDKIFGLSRINDIKGQTLLFAKVTAERGIFQKGLDVLNRFTIMLSIGGLIFAVLVLFILRKVILKRLYNLSQNLLKIGNDHHSSERVEVNGSDEIAQVANATNQMLTSLERAFLQRQQDVERQRIQNGLLINLAKDHAVSDGNTEEVAIKITAAVVEACGADRASLWLFDEQMNHFNCIDQLEKKTMIHSSKLTLPYSYLRQLISQLRHTGSVRMDSATQLADTTSLVDSLDNHAESHLESNSLLIVSIKFKGQLHGFIAAEHMTPDLVSPIDEEVFLLSLADFVEQTIAAKERIVLEKELWRLASYDNLTQLPNRSYFNSCLNSAVESAKAREQKMALLFIDLDKFKPINDNYGHAAGDELLRQVAKRMKLAVRDDDVLARIGGDEFTVLLTRIQKPADALKVAKKLVTNLSNPFSFEDKQLNAGCSIGIAMFPDHADRADALLSLADTAMYQAKSKGRNQALLYTPPDKASAAKADDSVESPPTQAD